MVFANLDRRGILIAVVLLLSFLAYAVLRWSSASPAFDHARQISDTKAYLRIAGEPLHSLNFIADNRPPVYPFVLKVFRGNLPIVAAFQTGFSIFAWGVFALAVARSFRDWLRPFAFFVILLLSLSKNISGWDVVILTESLSLSLMVLLLAAWLWLLQGWMNFKAMIMILVAALWAFTRDTNAWVLLMVAVAALVSVLTLGASKRYLWISVGYVCLFILSNWNADIGNRWVYPFQNVLAQRILPEEESVVYFSSCGMPVTPELLSLAGGFANSKARAFYVAPTLDSYREWLHAHGKGCYVRWLLASPVRSLTAPLTDLVPSIAFRESDRFFPQQLGAMVPSFLEALVYPAHGVLWMLGLSTLLALAAWCFKTWKFNRAWAVAVMLCLMVYPQFFIVWHGDTVGTDRHTLSVGVQFAISIWLFFLLVIEGLYLRYSRRFLGDASAVQ